MIAHPSIEANILEGFRVKSFHVDDGLHTSGKRWERREVIKAII